MSKISFSLAVLPSETSFRLCGVLGRWRIILAWFWYQNRPCNPGNIRDKYKHFAVKTAKNFFDAYVIGIYEFKC